MVYVGCGVFSFACVHMHYTICVCDVFPLHLLSPQALMAFQLSLSLCGGVFFVSLKLLSYRKKTYNLGNSLCYTECIPLLCLRYLSVCVYLT